MNTWAFLSDWSQDDFHNEPLVSVLNSPEYPLDRSFAPIEIAILLWKPFIDLFLCMNRPFGFSAHASLFLGCFFLFFFHFFYCFTVRLRTWTLFKMNEIFISLRKKLFSSSTCIWSKWTFKVRNVGQVRVYAKNRINRPKIVF